MKMKNPKIGIPMRLESATRRFYLGRDYGEALEAFGGIPLHVSLIPGEDYIAGASSDLDGILLPGSDTDVDPLNYNEEPHAELGTVIAEKDETDLLILREAEKLKMPVLAICFGMQILNVFRGGSLFQDIKSQVPNSLKHEQGVPLGRASHTIEVENQSFLKKLTGAGSARVNSHHHQSVKRVGENLKATAWAKDGVIECIEDTRAGRFNFGVQWHPEHTWKNDALSKNIFETFIKFCAKYKAEKAEKE